MERRSFIKFAGIALGSSVILPKLGMAAHGWGSHLDRLVSLPQTTGHVRHGLFQLRAINHPFIPQWLQLFERHRFFANGIDRGTNDLELFSVRVQEQLVTLGYDHTHAFMIQDEALIDLDNRTDHVQDIMVLRGAVDKVVLEEAATERFFITLNGSARVNGARFEEGDFIVSDRALEIDQEEGISLLLPKP